MSKSLLRVFLVFLLGIVTMGVIGMLNLHTLSPEMVLIPVAILSVSGLCVGGVAALIGTKNAEQALAAVKSLSVQLMWAMPTTFLLGWSFWQARIALFGS